MTRRDVHVSAGMAIVLFVASVACGAVAGMGRGGNLGAAMLGGILFIIACICAVMCVTATVAVRRERRVHGFDPIMDKSANPEAQEKSDV